MQRSIVHVALWGLVFLAAARGAGAGDAPGTGLQVAPAPAPGDSLAAPGDSLAVPGDSLAVPGDSLASPGDSLAAPPDSAGAVGDSGAPAGGAARDGVIHEPPDIRFLGNSLHGLRPMYAYDFREAGGEEMLELVSFDPAGALVPDAGIRYIDRGFYGGPQFISVRGRDPHTTGFTMDGVPVTDPQIEVFDPHWLPIEGTERIEVIKGPATALSGGGGAGGLMNWVSHNVLPPVPLTRTNVWFGSFDTRLVGASFSRSVGSNFGLMGAYDYFSTAGHVDGASSKGEKLYAKVSARFPASVKFDVIAYRHVGDTGVLGAGYTGRLDNRTFLDLSVEMGKESVYDLDFYYFDVRETFRGDSLNTYDGSLAGVNLVWTGDEAVRHVRRLGASVKTKNTTAVKDILEGSGFAEFAYDRGWLAGLAIVRAEQNSEHGFQYALSVPLTFALPRGFGLAGRVDRGYTYPLARGITTSGEGDEVEKVRSVAGGILWNAKILRLSLNMFYYDISDAAVYTTGDSCDTHPVRGAGIDMVGGEIGVYLPPLHGFEGTVSFSTGDSNEAVEGESQTQPLSVVAWGIRYGRQFTRHIGSGLTFAGRWSSRTDLGRRWKCVDEACTVTECLDDAGLPAVKSALLYGYLAFDDARVFFRIRNLFNEKTPVSWDNPSLPARSYEFGLTWDLHD